MLDVVLPDSSGLDLQKRLTAEQPDLPVIFLAKRVDVSTTVQAMKAGAIEFLTTSFHSGELLDAIRDALERSRRAREHAAKMKPIHESYALLTPRERQVMALVNMVAALGLLAPGFPYLSLAS